MFSKILLPVDLTDRHEQALRIAGELAVQSKGTITLLHVIEIIPGLSMDEERAFYDRLERIARAHLDRLGKHLKKNHVSWKAEVRFGSRAGECVHHAVDSEMDLIILTAPRITQENVSAGWGSMGYKIGILSQCPVLLVK